MRSQSLIKFLLIVSTTFLFLSCAAYSDDESSVRKPKFELKSERAFNPGDISAYSGEHEDIYAYIDANLDQHVKELQRWLRQKSISAQNDGIQEMAAMLRDDFAGMGFKEAEIVPTDGHPGVWGFYDAGAEKTLML